MEEQLVILKTYMYPAEAYPLMSKLESEEIMCFLDGENTISVHPFLSNAIGGVKLKIRKSDADRALKIIKESEERFTEIQKQEEEPIPEKFRKGFKKVDTFCPECNSTRVFRKKMAGYKIFLAVILAPFYVPLLFVSKWHYCANCNYEWKQ
jgi:hypothetical protein